MKMAVEREFVLCNLRGVIEIRLYPLITNPTPL